jgi:predicted TPR repeat methyltransferase
MEPTEGNRRAFDLRHGAVEQGLPAALRAGLQNLEGRRVLHLGCWTGLATVELAGLGALVTGVDPSTEALAAARERAPDLPWLRAALEHLPAELQRGRFDLVLSGSGSLARITDLDAWAAGIAVALRPGGELIVHDEHPVSACLDVGLRWRDDYFDGETVRLGHVVNAVAGAGLVIRRLDELPAQERRQDPRVPGELLLLATKPG